MGEQETDAQRTMRYELVAQERGQLADQLDYDSQLLRRVTDRPDGPVPQEREVEGHRNIAWLLRKAALRVCSYVSHPPDDMEDMEDVRAETDIATSASLSGSACRRVTACYRPPME